MRDTEVERIKIDHVIANKYITAPQCPICHHPMWEGFITRTVGLTDIGGGEGWSEKQEIPVWKCVNGHSIHFEIMEVPK